MGELVDRLETTAGLSFGDRIRVRSTSETQAAGVAGATGTILGHTTVSLGYASDVIGEPNEDVAVHVDLDGRDEGIWIAPGLVEFVDTNAGLEIGIGATRLVRAPTGAWTAAPAEDER